MEFRCRVILRCKSGSMFSAIQHRYAKTHPTVYRRIEAVAKAGEQLRVLDLTDPAVRKAVAEAKDVRVLYEGDFASDY